MSHDVQCQVCGHFMRCDRGASWANIYEFPNGGLDREILRCSSCTEIVGEAQSNARPHDGNMSPYQGVFP
jgi:hypothetical protein